MRLACLAIVTLALALRLSHLSSWSLNNDEVAQATWSSLSFAEMMREVRRDAVHPPLDYLMQFVAGRLGPDWVRRLPPALFGVAAVAMIMMLARAWAGRAAAVAAGLFIAVSPAHIYYSQEVRPYSLGLFLISSSLVALELYANTSRRRWGVAWAVLVFLAGSTLYIGGLVAAAAGFVRIFIDRHDRLGPLWRRLPLIVAVWTLLYSPWLRVVRHASRIAFARGSERLDWPWWSHRLQSLGAGNEKIYEEMTMGSWVFWAAVAIGVALSAKNRLLRVAAFVFVAGTALQILVLQIHPRFSAVRYMAPVWVLSFVLAGAGVAFLFNVHWTTRPVGIAVLCVFAGYSAIRLAEYYRGERSDWGRLARYVHARVKPGDTVIVTNDWVARNFAYHWYRMPTVAGVAGRRFDIAEEELRGPVWIVSGQCRPREPLLRAGLMMSDVNTELAQVRYLRAGQTLPAREELCPE